MTTDEPDEPAAAPRAEPPVMPTAAEAAAARGDEPVGPPPAVRYAFVVWLLAGLFGIVNAVIMLVNKQAFIEDAIRQKPSPNITNERVANGTTTQLWMFLLAAVTFAVLFTLMAYKAQEAVRRARLMLTMLCLINVVFYLVVLRGYLSPLVAALILAGTVLLYLPRSNLFFRPGELPT